MLPYRCVSPQCAMPLCQSYTRFDACPVSCLRCMSPCSTPVLLLSLLSPGSRPVSAGSLCCKLVLALPDFKPTQATAHPAILSHLQTPLWSALIAPKPTACRWTGASPRAAATQLPSSSASSMATLRLHGMLASPKYQRPTSLTQATYAPQAGLDAAPLDSSSAQVCLSLRPQWLVASSPPTSLHVSPPACLPSPSLSLCHSAHCCRLPPATGCRCAPEGWQQHQRGPRRGVARWPVVASVC